MNYLVELHREHESPANAVVMNAEDEIQAIARVQAFARRSSRFRHSTIAAYRPVRDSDCIDIWLHAYSTSLTRATARAGSEGGRTMNQPLTWEQLDACSTSDEIADLLRKHGIQGRRSKREACPLARATGWSIDEERRTLEETGETKPLTQAQADFVFDFDAILDYQDLEE